jgi:hypothetical protein
LDHAAQRGNGADLGADQLLHFGVELLGGDGGGWVVGCRESDEGEGEVAFEFIWDANDAALCDRRVGGDGLLDGA